MKQNYITLPNESPKENKVYVSRLVTFEKIKIREVSVQWNKTLL